MGRKEPSLNNFLFLSKRYQIYRKRESSELDSMHQYVDAVLLIDDDKTRLGSEECQLAWDKELSKRIRGLS